jgi:hypothetical protein
MQNIILGISCLALAVSCFVIAITLIATNRPGIKEFLYFSFRVLFTASILVIALSALLFGMRRLK